jgi:hypothetical protein
LAILPTRVDSTGGVEVANGVAMERTDSAGGVLATRGVAKEGNTSFGTGALQTTPRASSTPPSDSSNVIGNANTAIGLHALFSNRTGELNTASGVNALFSNTTGQLQHRERTQCALWQHHGRL